MELFFRVLDGRFGGEKAAGTPEVLGKSQVRLPVSGSDCCVTSRPQTQWF